MRLIGPFAQIVPMRGLPLKGGIADEKLEVIPHGGIVIGNDPTAAGDNPHRESILAVGSFTELRQAYPDARIEEVSNSENSTLLPGFVDAHTHICFAGNRARDYALRVAGKSYLEIAKAGGGIWDSVQQTRNAALEELATLTAQRANHLLQQGITTIEVKSGYGLQEEQELKILRAIKQAQAFTSADLIPTCLAAHMKPRDFEGSQQAYLNGVLERLLPQIKRENLSTRVDIFVEESAFDVESSREFLRQAQVMGFELTVHADQFSTGGSALAVELSARSADHLEASTEEEIKLLAASETVAVALPGASLGLGMQFTPARKLLDAGACLAIASDWNPGSAPMGDLLVQASVLGAYEKLSLAETLAGLTFRAAAALGLQDRGKLDAGQRADLQAYPTGDYRDIFYQQGTLKPHQVWTQGNRIDL